MNFKEYIADDISNTFINNNEFADEVLINGVKVNVVEDSDKLEHRIKKDYDGLIIGDVLFYISEAEYRKIPRVTNPPTANQSISYKGKPSIITRVNVNLGVYEVIIQHAGGR